MFVCVDVQVWGWGYLFSSRCKRIACVRMSVSEAGDHGLSAWQRWCVLCVCVCVCVCMCALFCTPSDTGAGVIQKEEQSSVRKFDAST